MHNVVKTQISDARLGGIHYCYCTNDYVVSTITIYLVFFKQQEMNVNISAYNHYAS